MNLFLISLQFKLCMTSDLHLCKHYASAIYLVPEKIKVCVLFLQVSPLQLFLWAKKASSHPWTKPSSPDHLAACYKSVINCMSGPRQEGSLTHRVRKLQKLADLLFEDRESCNPPVHPSTCIALSILPATIQAHVK